jgi:hypothetical protein
MDHHLEATGAVARLQVGQDVHQIAMALVVVPVYPPRPVPLSEIEQHRGQVVGQFPVVQPGGPEGLAHEDVEEQRLRRHQHRPHGQQPLEQLGRVEQRIRPFGGEPPLEVGAPMRRTPAEQQDHQLQVRCGQAAARIRPDHG